MSREDGEKFDGSKIISNTINAFNDPAIRDGLEQLVSKTEPRIITEEEKRIDEEELENIKPQLDQKKIERVNRIQMINMKLTQLKSELHTGNRNVLREVSELLYEVKTLKNDDEIDNLISNSLDERIMRAKRLEGQINGQINPQLLNNMVSLLMSAIFKPAAAS